MSLAWRSTALETPQSPSLEGGEGAASTRARRRWGAAAALGALLAVYGLLLAAFFAPAICMPDDNGYFAQASLMVREQTTWFVPASDAQYIGMHWLLTPDGKYVSRYPAGLSALIAPLYALLGWKAAVLVNPLLAVGAVAGLFLFVRRLTGQTVWALAAGAVVVLNPTFFSHALAGDAHTGVACMVAWAMWLLLSWSQDRRLWQAAGAGVALGMIPVIRYPDVVMYAGFGAMVFYSAWRWTRGQAGVSGEVESPAARVSWGKALAHIGLMAAVALLVISPQLVRNQMVLGAFWKTGYALTNEQTGFGWGYFKDNFWLYIRTLPTSGMGPFLALSVAGMAVLTAMRSTRAVGLMMIGVTGPMLLLYMAYYWAGMGGGGGGGGGGGAAGNGAGIMRFLVPTFVAYAAAGVFVLAEATRRLPRAGRVAVPVAVVLMQGLWAIPDLGPRLDRTKLQRENLAAVTTEMQRLVPQGAVVVTEQGLLQHLDFVRLWKLADPSALRGGGMPMRGGPGGGMRSDSDPSPMQMAKQRLLQQRYSGSATERRERFFADCEKWAAGSDDKGVYLVGSETEVRSLIRGAADLELRIAGRVVLAQAANNNEPRRSGDGGGPGGGAGGGPGDGPGGPGGPSGPGGPGGGQGGPAGRGIAGLFGAGPGGGPNGGPGGGFGGGPGRGGRMGGGGGGGGGIMSAGTFGGATEVVIAQLIRRAPTVQVTEP